MEEILDTDVKLGIQQERPVIYGSFWPRLWASLLDGLIVGCFSVPISTYNSGGWKSIPVLILVSLVSIAYKPFCEYRFGATAGKMALKLKVVNLHLQRATLQEVLLRNLFHFVPVLFSFGLSLSIYLKPEFEQINNFRDYSVLAAQASGKYYVYTVSLVLPIVDLIFLLTDKRCRTLHDRIGKTFVIKEA
jgi:uncharacterized RDD family membrane protein YckC